MYSHLAKVIEHHHYPDWLKKNPRWIHCHYRLLRLLYLRSRVCRRQLYRLLGEQASGAQILDAGCGEGQFLVPAVRDHPDLSFTGIDKNHDHIHFLKSLVMEAGYPNVHLMTGNVERKLLTPIPMDMIYMISVLQYTESPDRLIQRFHNIQPDGGTLMIYTPAGPVFTFGFSRWLKKKYSHYDAAQPIYQPLEEEKLIRWIGEAGYSIVKKQYLYGRAAALGHEILQSLIILITHWRGIFKIIPGVILLIFSPIFVSLQVVDELKKPNRGNGVLLILEKRKPGGQKQ